MRSRLLAFIFGVIICLPTVDTLFGLTKGFNNTENRRLSQVPVLHLPHIQPFISQFKIYFQENFGFRNLLFYTYSHWKFYGMGESPLPEKVILGKNEWFYLGNASDQVVDQHRGLMPFSTDTLQAIALRLTRHRQKLAQQGIKLVVLIAPDAQTIYPENLPDWALPYSRPSRLDQFMDYMNRFTKVSVLDVRDTLLASKVIHPVYFNTNSHWNGYGALISCAMLINKLQPDFPTLTQPTMADYQIQEAPPYFGTGDLVELVMLQNSIQERHHCQVNGAPYLNVRHIDTLAVPNNYDSFRVLGPDSQQPRLLLVGDSFSGWLLSYLPAYFGQSYFARSRHLDPALIQAEKPNVVVVEIVERHLNWLLEL